MDETFIKIRVKWVYPYRAVDKEGLTVDFRLSSKRYKQAVANFLSQAIGNNGASKKINIDKSGANTAGIEFYNALSKTNIEIGQCKYFNNIVEGDYYGLRKSLTSVTVS